MSQENQKPGPKSPRRRRFLRWALGAGFISVPTGVYAHQYEPEEIRVAELTIPIPDWPASLNGLRVGHISDTHTDSERAFERTRRAARLLRKQKPDVVFLTGDYITHYPHIWMAATAEALAPLKHAPHGAFAVLGNHDHWAGEPDHVERCLKRNGFHVLRNGSAPLIGDRRVWVVGLEYRCDRMQDPIKALRGVTEDAVKLLLIHEPDYADEAPQGFALQFSGHSHGGQVRVPGMPPILAPIHGRRHPEGLCDGKSHRVYTTRGVGMVSPKFRFCCPPEVGVVTLVRA